MTDFVIGPNGDNSAVHIDAKFPDIAISYNAY